MAAVTAQYVVTMVRILIHDSVATYRYPDTDLLLWVTEGQREIISMRPDAYVNSSGAQVSTIPIPDPGEVSAVGTSLHVSQAFIGALVDYVCYRAMLNDSESAGNAALASNYLQNFILKLKG